MPENQTSLGALPPIAPSTTSLTEIICGAYRVAVNNLSLLTGDDFRHEKNRLFWGHRQGSKIDGVRDPKTVELLFRRITTSCDKNPSRIPIIGYPVVDADGNNIYCFKLTHHYAHKGKSIIGSIRTIMEMHDHDRIGIGKDYDEELDEDIPRFQAAKMPWVESDFVTVILSGDNSKFIAWFCGEPMQIWTPENIHMLIRPDGSLDLGHIMVRVGIDYDIRSKEIRHQIRMRKFHQPRHPVTKPTGHIPAPINSVAQALQVQENQVVQPNET